MNVKIEVQRVDHGWLATCGTVEATRPTKASAIASCRTAVLRRLDADTRMPRVIPALDAGRIFVAMPDPDGGTLVLSINKHTGRASGLCAAAPDLDHMVGVYKRHAASLCADDGHMSDTRSVNMPWPPCGSTPHAGSTS